MSTTLAAPPGAPTAEAAPKKGKRGKLLVIVLLVVVLAGGGAAYKVLGAKKGAAEPPAPKPGAVVKLDSINLNLAEGHYLKLGIALQASADAEKTLDGSRALDLAISLFSDRSIRELSSGKGREAAKAQLREQLAKAYDGKVIDVYFTEFVMQ